MVKIKPTKLLILGILSVMLLASAAYAQNLKFKDVDVKVGGRSDKNLNDGERIGRDAEPEDSVEFDVEMENNFTQSSDPEIENIIVTVTIEGIDGEDGDDLEEESREFDLRPGRDKKVSLNFQVPLEVEEGDYEVLIEAEGEDTNGTNHVATMKLTLEVNKERDQLKLHRNILSPNQVTCNRRGVSHTVGLINIGEDDQDDVIVTISNPDLVINEQETIETLEAEPFEDESRWLRTFTYDVPEELGAGNYRIDVKASYGNKVESENANLAVNDCVKEEPKKEVKEEPKEEVMPPEPKEEEKEEEIVEVITPPTSAVIAPPVVEQPQQPAEGETVEQEGILSNTLVLASIIAVEVILVVAGVALVVYLARRK